MTIKINRYNLKEIKTVRITKKGTSRTIESDIDELLELNHYPEVDNIEILHQIRDLQKAIKTLCNNKDLEIELDFMEK